MLSYWPTAIAGIVLKLLGGLMTLWWNVEILTFNSSLHHERVSVQPEQCTDLAIGSVRKECASSPQTFPPRDRLAFHLLFPVQISNSRFFIKKLQIFDRLNLDLSGADHHHKFRLLILIMTRKGHMQKWYQNQFWFGHGEGHGTKILVVTGTLLRCSLQWT